MRNTKPIRVFYSTLSGRFYATRSYRMLSDGKTVVCTGERFDVTNDIGAIIEEYGVTFSAAAPSPPARENL